MELNNILIYLLIITTIFNLRVSFLHFADILCLSVIFIDGFSIKKIKLRKKWIRFILIPLGIILFTVFIKVFVWGESTNFSGLSVPMKIINFAIYFLTLRQLDIKKCNYNVILSCLSMPLFLNIIMYRIPVVNYTVLSLYGMNPYPFPSRFGGIYGFDVNTLGLYASVVVMITLAFFYYRKIKIMMGMGTLALAFINTIFSGMRAGIVALAASLFLVALYNYRHLGKIVLKIRKIMRKNWFLPVTAILCLGTGILFIYMAKYGPQNFRERFSIGVLLNDFKLTNYNQSSNANVMLKYFMQQVGSSRNRSIIFGYDTTVEYVDMLYGHFFIKYGLMGIMAIFFFTVYIYKVIKRESNKNMMLLYFWFSVIISFKGIFILDTRYIFLSVLLASFFYAESSRQASKSTQRNQCKCMLDGIGSKFIQEDKERKKQCIH